MPVQLGEAGVKAWKGLANRPPWLRTNTDLLEKLAGKSDDYIAKVDELYSPTVMKLPPNLKPPNGNPPGSYKGIEYDKFGFPKMKPYLSDPKHVVKIAVKGTNSDYSDAIKLLEKVNGVEKVRWDNGVGSSIYIKQNGVETGPYTWHHHQDGTSMMPVIQSKHRDIQSYHTGGRATASRGLVNLFDY